MTAVVEYLVVAGGGGGGAQGGGGGAGGVRANTGFAVTAQAYSITVGAGGAGGAAGAGATAAQPGGNSVFDSITATGGGRGAGANSAAGVPDTAGNGGSGGGGAVSGNTSNGGTGTAGQGNNGGNNSTASHFGAGGGGGANATGANGTTTTGGNGGAGVASSITGASVTYGGGGGGGIFQSGTSAGTGGAGGGGNGGIYYVAAGGTAPTAGTANTGGGGGGSGETGSTTQPGAAGGSGVVTVRYKTDGTDGVDPASTTGGTITTSGGYTIHKFTSNGTFTVALSVSNDSRSASFAGAGVLAPVAKADVKVAASFAGQGLFGPVGTTGRGATRTVSGKIYSDEFATSSGWTLDSGFSVVSDHPIPVSYLSPVPLLARTGSGDESSVLREVTPMCVSDSLWYVLYDSSDVNTAWTIHLAKSTNKGRTWTRLGIQTSIAHSGPAAWTMSGFLVDGGDGYYYAYTQNSTAVQGDGVPIGNYSGAVYRCLYANIEANNWAWVRDTPSLGGSGAFDEQCHETCCIVNINGTLHSYASARTASVSGVTGWTIAHDTMSSYSSAMTKDGNGGATLATAINNNTGTGARPECPFVWFWAELGSGNWAMSTNAIASDASQAEANDTFIVSGTASVQPDWNVVGSYRARIMYPGQNANRAMGYIKPLTGSNGGVQKESDGAVGFFSEWNATDSQIHIHRDITQGQLEVSNTALQFTDGSPGQNTTAYYAIKNVGAHGNCVIEFSLDFDAVGGGANAWSIGVMYRQDNGKDATGTGYYLDIEPTGAVTNCVTLRRMNAGIAHLTSLYVQNAGVPAALDSRNRQPYAYRIVANGGAHKLYGNGAQIYSITDGSPVASGSYFAIRGVGAIAKTRKLSIYSSDTVSLVGCPAGAAVSLRGAGGTVFGTATADGSGNATITSTHYPLYQLEVNGVFYDPADGGRVWGGDTFDVTSGDISVSASFSGQGVLAPARSVDASVAVSLAGQGAFAPVADAGTATPAFTGAGAFAPVVKTDVYVSTGFTGRGAFLPNGAHIGGKSLSIGMSIGF